MKLTIDPKLLADTVAWTARALPARPIVPVLSGLLLQADNDQLVVSAFDYDTSAVARITCDVAEPGRIVIPGRLLAEVAKALPDRLLVDLTATDTEATIRSGRSDFTLRLLPADDYPKLPEPPAPAGQIDAAALAAAVNQVAPATSNDDTLPMLTGIRLDTNADQLTLAATDRYRIAVTDTTWQPDSDNISALIPGKHLADIVKGLDHGPVTIGLDPGMASLSTADRTTTIRLIDEQFIDYRARVAMDTTITATIDAQALAAAVKRVALVADRKTGTAVRLAFTNSEVTVRAGGDDIGRGNEALDCELAGEPIEIAFQSSFLLDALGAIPGTATIGMTKPTMPALFSSEDSSHRQVVMALRLTT
ncbi:DNA polymerase III subunit beta [Nonomuraea sp. NPDC004580]|uniref:DNA polymerase III subunit beta n=1 Tax=Nonomuraea sp. NPDC004580 TaxID=3154552 RepID=UPI0033A31233